MLPKAHLTSHSRMSGSRWVITPSWLSGSLRSFFFVSVQFSRSVVSDSLWPHESQHAKPPCPSPTPGAYSNSCPSSRWCHPAISSTVIPFSSSWAISNPKRWCCESAALNMPASLENSAVVTGLEKVSFHLNPKEGQCQRMLKLPHNCTHLTR